MKSINSEVFQHFIKAEGHVAEKVNLLESVYTTVPLEKKPKQDVAIGRSAIKQTCNRLV